MEDALQALDDAQEEALLLEESRNDLLTYITTCDPTYVTSAWHVYVARKLHEVEAGITRFITVSVPPRHGKSRLIAIEFATWFLGRNPTKSVVVAAYGKDLTLIHSSEARTRVESETFNAIFGRGMGRRKKLDHWDIDTDDESREGSYKSAGVDSALTGAGADLLIIDDPHKDFAEAHSPAQRQKIWDWFLSVALTRLSPGGRIIIIQTRWHADDLVGRVTSKDYREKLHEAGLSHFVFQEITLPAIAEENDPIGRSPGEALFPERIPLDMLRAIRIQQGGETGYMWVALYQQKPRLQGGNYIPVDKFKLCKEAPEGLAWYRFWDLAAKIKEQNDFTTGGRVAIDASDGRVYLKDIVIKKLLWPLARKTIQETAKREKTPTGVEAQGGFATAFANLAEDWPSDVLLREYTEDKDKLVRAFPWIAKVESGLFFIVEGENVDTFLSQAAEFPDGENDDLIDMVSGGYRMAETKAAIFVTTSQPGKHSRALASRSKRSLD